MMVGRMSPAVAVKTFRRESSKGRGDRMKNSRLPTGCRETSRLPSKTAFAVAPVPRDRLFQLFHQHLGLSSALFVFLAAAGRQVLGRALGEPALGLEVSECLC